MSTITLSQEALAQTTASVKESKIQQKAGTEAPKRTKEILHALASGALMLGAAYFYSKIPEGATFLQTLNFGPGLALTAGALYQIAKTSMAREDRKNEVAKTQTANAKMAITESKSR